MMKILHTISGMGVRSGGPSLSTYMLVRGLRTCGVDAAIAAYDSSESDNASIANDEFINFLTAPKSRRYGYSKEFNKFFATHQEIDVFHAHGLWQYPTHATARWALKVNKPYVITPKGMLYPEGLRKSSVFKKLAMALYQKRDLQSATCIHATCEQEYEFIRDCGISKTPVAIIPNAVDIAGIKKKSPDMYGSKRVGFVGRFAPIKNLEVLLNAWAKSRVESDGWKLVLVGDGEPEYRKSLENLAFNTLQLKNVSFPGFLCGEAKEDMLQSFDCLVLPSKSENFGMVVAEALARGIPVIASKGTPWSELQDYSFRCGWWVDGYVEALAATLNELRVKDGSGLRKMGNNGVNLVKSRYTKDVTAKAMKSVYMWLLGEFGKPECIRFD